MKYRIKECDRRDYDQKLNRVFLVQRKVWLFWLTIDWWYSLEQARKCINDLKTLDELRRAKPIKPIIHDM